MKSKIFLTIAISFLAIFFLSMVGNFYTILQINRSITLAKSILTVDSKLTDLEKKLSDHLLSMAGYGSKYILAKDDDLKRKFYQEKENFDQHLAEIMLIADTEEARNLLEEIKSYNQDYQSSFAEEVKYLESVYDYPKESYEQKRDKALDVMMQNLKKLRIYSQTQFYSKTFGKVGKLEWSKQKAIRVVVVMAITCLVLIIAILIIINRRIAELLIYEKEQQK